MSTALLIVDVQYDFLPGGALGVVAGDEVVPTLAAEIAVAARGPVLFSMDFHPANHISFSGRGGPWPPHCVQGTRGSIIDPRLLTAAPNPATVVKGMDPEVEAYSAFDGEVGGVPLPRYLRDLKVDTVRVGGLATDYCVRATVLDARVYGFYVEVLTDAVRAVDVKPGDGAGALAEMEAAGAVLL